ncbi:hypothetical protein Golax_010535 [Gossypium laxum]|uniref:Uncharacterized protein n=1 Tax=Gossypium laxum TaxID=34288 RepID=A0A7J8ZJ66_9ROSI|nr:hypothetical protein [Gossypium laxum]
MLDFYAKLWGILDGLKLIQRRDHDKGIQSKCGSFSEISLCKKSRIYN